MRASFRGRGAEHGRGPGAVAITGLKSTGAGLAYECRVFGWITLLRLKVKEDDGPRRSCRVRASERRRNDSIDDHAVMAGLGL